jgi:hypothetical protein
LTFIIVPLKSSRIELPMVSKYRARHCPNCHYFVGFAVAKTLLRGGAASLTNFCLNCNYKLPVHTIVRGNAAVKGRSRRSKLRLIVGVHASGTLLGVDQSHAMNTTISPADYARHLRAIGQDLENLHLSTFNLESVGDAYLVWVRSESEAEANPVLRISKNRLRKLWRNKMPALPIGHEEPDERSQSETARRLRYSVRQLDRIEREQRARRRPQNRTTDGHRLSQLLRTVGDLVNQRGERLLGIAWQELSISVVVETSSGRKEIDVFRPDNLYDLWVRMYLKRDSRALIDTPH